MKCVHGKLRTAAPPPYPLVTRPTPGASRQARNISLGYLVAAIAWIVVTDLALAATPLPARWDIALQTIKGVLFVTLSAGLIWWLVRRALARHERAERELETARAIYEDLAEQNRERNKELSCLYAVAERLHEAIDPDAVLPEIPALLPPGWRVPELAEASISLRGRTYQTDRFETTEWTLEAPIVVEGEQEGTVAVAYRHDPGAPEPFLREERDLIRHIAAEISSARHRARAEAERQRSEAYFRSLTEHSHDLTTVFDPDGTILYPSRASEHMLGRPAEARAGENVFDHIHPEDAPDLRAKLEAGLHDRQATIEATYRIRHASGEWRWFETAARNLMDDPAVGGLMAHSRDITERRRAEEQLRLHAQLLDEVGQAVVAADLDGTVIYWNRTAADLLARPPQEAEGRPLPAVLAVNGRERILEEMVARAIERGRDDREVEVTGGRQQSIPAYLTVTCFRDEHGAKVGTVVVITDLTDQRLLQRQLERAQRMEAVGRLAGGIAHDFNNILTGIRGFSQMALEELPQGHVAREDVEEIRRSTDRAVELTRQLLAFGRRQVLQPRVVDLNHTIRDMQRMLEQIAGGDVDFAVELGSDTAPACVDPAQIEQVLVNLVVNARDAISGPGRIDLRTRGATVDEPRPLQPTGTLERGRYAVIEVEDTGSGIPPELVERVFEPFFSTKAETKGTGLGLSTVYGVVEQSGGVLDLDTQPGRGTRFTIYLPAVRGTEDVTTGEEADPGPSGGAGGMPGTRGTVLLVEDDDAVRVLVRRILGREGYDVLEAATPEEALEITGTRGGEVVLVLSDMVMPGMDGPELLRRLRSRLPGAATILMSGYAAEEIMERGRRSADHFIAKPFAPAALLHVVREALRPAEDRS